MMIIDNNHIPCENFCRPGIDLGAGLSVSLELLLNSPVVCRFMQEAMFDCSFKGTIFECTIVDLSMIPKKSKANKQKFSMM